MSNVKEYNDLYAFHPGYYVEEIIEDMDISHAEFATRMGTSAKTISQLISGKCKLTSELAGKLASMTGMSVDIWLNLQKEYDSRMLEIDHQKSMDAQADIMKCIDYHFFEQVANLPVTRVICEQVNNLCSYLHVSDLRILAQPDFLVNFRTGTPSFDEKNLINARAWVQTALNHAKAQDNQGFDSDKLKAYIPEIRSMTVQDYDVFLPRLREIFSECGVAFVLLHTLKNSGINGAVKWFGQNQVMLALNDRRCYADTFWFALFHEIKHVLQQKPRMVFISYSSIAEVESTLEEEADSFSANVLIPTVEYKRLHSLDYKNKKNIISFAESIGIHPGIVVGRLQNDHCIEHSMFNDLKAKYQICLS